MTRRCDKVSMERLEGLSVSRLRQIIDTQEKQVDDLDLKRRDLLTHVARLQSRNDQLNARVDFLNTLLAKTVSV